MSMEELARRWRHNQTQYLIILRNLKRKEK